MLHTWRRLTGSIVIAAMALLVFVHPFVVTSSAGDETGHELRSSPALSHFVFERHSKSYEEFSPKGLTFLTPEEFHAAFELYVATGCTADRFIPQQRHLLYTLATSSSL